MLIIIVVFMTSANMYVNKKLIKVLRLRYHELMGNIEEHEEKNIG